MKDLFKKVKKTFGAEDDEAARSKLPDTVEKKAVKESSLPPASRKREEIVRFIIHGLRPYINEKNTGIKGIHLFVTCGSREEENLVNVALHADRPRAFQEEVLERKLSDNYLVPDAQWLFEFSLVRHSVPDCEVSDGAYGMNIIKDHVVTGKVGKAKIVILSGQAAYSDYILDPVISTKYKIGRGLNPALPSGQMHHNDIAFLDKGEEGYSETIGAGNLTVSRFHATIVFNPEQKKYFIAADKGGTPESGNKTKLFSENGKMTRLDIPGAMHVLSEGDQVELGGNARLRFNLVI